MLMSANHTRSATVGFLCPSFGLIRSIRYFEPLPKLSFPTLNTLYTTIPDRALSFSRWIVTRKDDWRVNFQRTESGTGSSRPTEDGRIEKHNAGIVSLYRNELVENWLTLHSGDRKRGTQNDTSAMATGNEGLPGLPLDLVDGPLDDLDMLNLYAFSWPKDVMDVPPDSQFEKPPIEDSALVPQLPRDYQSEKHLPSPRLNYLQLQKLNFYAARIQNALHIGLPLFLACKEEEISPWYWLTQFSILVSSTSTADQLIDLPIPRPAQNKPCFNMALDIISDLAPTPLQRSRPHSMYLDMIPFPIFRDRVITLITMEPPAFDEDELKRDIENDGLMVWGTGQGSMERSASLVRDRRNWECADWFLRKWRLLVCGSGLDEQSQWWRRMRGED